MIFFKLPDEDFLYTVKNGGTEAPVSFVSFEEGTTAEFFGNIQNILENDVTEIKTTILPENEKIINEDKEEYLRRITSVISFIKEKNIEKLVVARRKIVDLKNEVIDLRQTFLNISATYPNAFRYLMRHENYCMIGAFSELLGKFDKKTSEFSTMSLAGTLPADEAWTEKETNEQRPVRQYIKNILEKYSEKIEISETYDHFSGKIKHLRNDFKVKIDREDLEKIIGDLHPTPAVCGIPKNFCKAAINNFEGFQRNFYAGYIRVETADFIYFFVNLRCAEFYKNVAILYAGGGITAQSQPEKEWRETELKAEAVLRNLAYE